LPEGENETESGAPLGAPAGPAEARACTKCGAASASPCSSGKAMPSELLLSTGDLARQCETTVRTVRFYEEEGLIVPVSRSEGGHRMFEPAQKLKLQLIMDLREAGLSLQDIRALLELKQGCTSAPDAAKQMTDALGSQIEQMQRKISVLRRLRDELASMMSTIRECGACDEPEFHDRCGGCDVMNRPDLPRAMRILWSRKG
jgi:DNA-binding transcriptional MerR regulator